MTVVTWDSGKKAPAIALSNGNLTATNSTYGGQAIVLSTQGYSTGKHYAEITADNPTSLYVGLGTSAADYGTNGHALGGDPVGSGWSYIDSLGTKYHDSSSVAYGATYTTGDVVSILWNADGGEISFWKNGVSQGVAYTGVSGTLYVGVGLESITTAVTANFGASTLAYTPPAGYSYWDGSSPPEPTYGDGAGTLEELTAVGSRIAAGAGTMEQLTAAGGYHGLGAGTLEYLVVSGAGGTKAGAGTLEALTGSATGYQAARGDATLEALTADATGYDSEIWTATGTAPVPRLSSSILTGEAITFAGEAPAPLLEIGYKDARLTAPKPLLSATILTGTISSIVARAPAPVLAAINFNPAIITVEGLARAPILTATLAAGQILTFAGSVRAPILSSSGLTGNVATLALEAVAPILSAAGYPAFTITFAGSAPPPRLAASLGFAVSENYRTWVLNTRKGALTSYDNFNFNSFCTYQGQILAANSSGIVVLGTQDLDNATAITARVRSGKDSFGSSYHKRVPRMYVGHNATGDLLVRMITTEGGERTYRLGWNHGVGLRQARVPIGRGPKSRYWQWEIENEAGASFNIDNVMLYPTKLRRRVQ